MLGAVNGHILHQRTKFHKDRSNRYGDIAIFVIFQDGGRPPSWICEIRIFLTVGTVKRPIFHQRTKFRKDRSNGGGDIAIFVIFQTAAAAILNFQKSEILMVYPL